jgi:hypothetical protein
MSAFEATSPDGSKFIVLEEHSEGCYILVYDSSGSLQPSYDYLQDDLQSAMNRCSEDYNISISSWQRNEHRPDIMKDGW